MNGLSVWWSLLVFVEVLLWRPCHGQTCTKVQECVWDCRSGSTGRRVDLTGIGTKSGNPRWFNIQAANDQYSYSYNPCYQFTIDVNNDQQTWLTECEGVVVCQRVPTGTGTFNYYNGGNQNTETVVVDGGNVVVKYTGFPSTQRYSEVSLKCDKNSGEVLKVLGETSPGEPYKFEMSTEQGCLSAENFPSDGGLSTGSILVILLFTFAVVYVVGGVLFLKYRRQAEGSELVPNRTFWIALPGLVKDGTVFFAGKSKDAIDKIRGRGTYAPA